jgi:hypothetical protein
MIPTLLAAFACLSSFSFAQPIPEHVRAFLDNHFHGWRINEYSLPSGCIEGEWAKLNPAVKSFYRCNLNEDKNPDYAIRLVTGRDSTLFEYFIALVSNAISCDLFVLDSCGAYKGAGHRYLLLLQAGHDTPIFGGDDTPELWKYARKGKNQQAYTFPVDAVVLEPICESYYKAVSVSGYVYIRNRFYEFSGAD